MWTIKQIFDGEYGCEELQSGEKPKVAVTLVNEQGEKKSVTVEDEWLTDNDLDVGSQWPIIHLRYGVIVANKKTERYVIAVSDSVDYPIIISRTWHDFPCAEGEYYALYDAIDMENAISILDLLKNDETSRARTKLKKSLACVGPYVDTISEVVLDDMIPDEWYDAWKEMEGIITISKHVPGYWEEDIQTQEL